MEQSIKKINYIKSYGIATFKRDVNDNLSVLLVKRKYTYAFFHFVTNSYKYGKKALLNIFNKITIEEKRNILKFDYDLLWKQIWYEPPTGMRNILYYKNKKIYEKNILENKNFVRDILYLSKNMNEQELEGLWTIPKGKKKSSNENSLLVAIREFEEETGIDKKKIYLNYNFKRYYITDYCYKSIFFIATYKNNNQIKFNFNNEEQLLETNNIKWMSLKEIQLYCPYLHEYLLPAFNYIKNNNLIL
jgi:8-oxo-dGTP pyrophosphatase MutT (NUDIX family)